MLTVPTQRPGALRASMLALACAALAGGAVPARAFQIDAGPDWRVNFDNTVLYNLGIRARGVDSRIGNDPTLQESDYRFADRGDIVTNRLSVLSEFDAVYDRRAGLRLSASAWKDFAYDERPRQNPGALVPGLPYAAITNYSTGEYSGYTKRYQVQGVELLDGFVFGNFDVAGRPATLRFGKMTQFWGNALFFGAAGINYSQSATDITKMLTAPGTQAKELAMPRGQINFSGQLADELQFGAQYFLQWQADRMPSGGTFLANATDFLFEGPDQFGLLTSLYGSNGLPAVRRQASAKPDGINNNFGLQLKWSPATLDGTLGFYYRQFDETAPWNPIFGHGFAVPGVPATHYFTGYRLSYPEKVKMLAVSLDKQIGGASVGLELSYRRGTGLNTNGMVFSAADPDNRRGARGNTVNVVANALSILDRSSWYDTGTGLVEVAVVHKLKVTEQADRYQGEGTAACAVPGRYTGCSTDTAVMIGGAFEPQWLQAMPSWDLSMPMSALYGLHGNAASNGIPVKQGDLLFGLGFKAVLQQRYNFTLQYNGFRGKATGMTNLTQSTATPAPVGTPGIADYYLTGNNLYRFNDRHWLSFTFSSTF